jgi:hypothetical protein
MQALLFPTEILLDGDDVPVGKEIGTRNESYKRLPRSLDNRKVCDLLLLMLEFH